MFSPIVTEHSGGIPLHSYITLIQTGGGGSCSVSFSENLVVPVGLAVITHASQLPDPMFVIEENDDLLKEIPDSLFDQCLGMVSESKKHNKQTSKKRQNKKKRASKRSWF